MTRHPGTRGLLVAMAAVVGMAPGAFAQAGWNNVSLSWSTPGDDSLTGVASQYDLRYSTAPITAANFASATAVTGLPAPAASGTTQRFTVGGLLPGTTYWFAIRTADEVPNWSGLSNVLSVTTSAAPDTIRPARVTTLAVTSLTDSTAQLGWTAVGDDSLAGTAASYEIRYSAAPITTANFASATAVSGAPAPAAPGTAQSVTARGLSRQATYWFAMIVRDEAGNASALSNVPGATTPDTAAPAAIRNLAVGVGSCGWITADALRPRDPGVRP